MPTITEDLRATLYPAPSSPRGLLPPLLVSLTVLSGVVDAVSYLVLGHVFVANMTGNVLLLGLAIVGAPGFSVASSAIALAAYLVGSLLGGRISRQLRAHPGRHLGTASAIQASFLFAASVLIAVTSAPHGTLRESLIVVLAVAMGIQGSTARSLAVEDLSTTVLTQTITGLAADSQLGTEDRARSFRRLVTIAAMLAGAVASAACVLHGATVVAVAAATAIAGAVGATAWCTGRPSSRWASTMG